MRRTRSGRLLKNPRGPGFPGQLWAVIVLTVLALIGPAAQARADSAQRPIQPACQTTAHFVIHCDGSAPVWMPAAVAATLETSYGRLVTGGGLQPNASLHAPVPDDDGKTDVYLRAPPDRPGVTGGFAYRDSTHTSDGGQAGYMFLTPDLDQSAVRFRAAHEFMHVIQRGYFGLYGMGLEEGLANWATEWSLDDVDPLDNNFENPHVPFDCTHGTFGPTFTACGNGYWQWLFFQRQVEAYGGGFISSFLERARALDLSSDFGMPALRAELAARTGLPLATALRSRFASYARDIWDPTAWQTTAVRSIFDAFGSPAVNVVRLNPGKDSGFLAASVPHLGARYIVGLNRDPAKGDRARVTVKAPPGLLADPVALAGREAGSSRRTVSLKPAGGRTYRATLPFGPRDRNHIVLPLINDTETSDGLLFEYRFELLRPPPQTTITKSSISSARRRATFRFRSSEQRSKFRCKLDKQPLRPCSSPKTYRNLKPGRHVFRVVATSRVGGSDRSAAVKKFSIRR